MKLELPGFPGLPGLLGLLPVGAPAPRARVARALASVVVYPLAALAALAGCGGVMPAEAGVAEDVGRLEQALGEPIGGRPSYHERLALYACNKARVEPATSAEHDWSGYPAVLPLQWNDRLARAARSHSYDMRDTPCFQHNSCDGTDPFTRIKSFFTTPPGTLGENIMAGINDGNTAIFNWIEEIGAPAGETGHRDNMFSPDFTHVGFGYATGGTKFQGYWTQDFGGKVPGATPIPPLSCGADFPSNTPTGNRTFGTIYYDAAGKAPDHVLLVLDGKAQSMTRVKGTDTAGAWEVGAELKSGCHRYYFSVVVGGKESMYPDTGTLGVDPAGSDDGSSCPVFAAGTVGGVGLNTSTGTGGGSGEQAGGCRASGRRGDSGGGDALALVVALALVAFRRRAYGTSGTWRSTGRV